MGSFPGLLFPKTTSHSPIPPSTSWTLKSQPMAQGLAQNKAQTMKIKPDQIYLCNCGQQVCPRILRADRDSETSGFFSTLNEKRTFVSKFDCIVE